MTTPLASLFHGDITIEVGCDTALYGYGDLNVYRRASIGTGNSTQSTNSSNGSLIVNGGLGVSANTNIAGLLTTYSNSNLRTAFFDTTWGGVNISGANGIIASIGSAITMTTSLGDINLQSLNNRIFLQSGEPHFDAISILASNVLGGVYIKTGADSSVNISTGRLGLIATAAAGPISLTAHDGNGEFIVNSASNNKNLTLKVNGNYDSGILMQSDGTNNNVPAIKINTTSSNGQIFITNNNNGDNNGGRINIFAGGQGLKVTTNTLGSISLTARNAASSFIVDSASAAKDLTIGVTGATDSSLILQSEGTSNIDAITIKNTNAAGSILIANSTAGSGGVSIYTGSGGLTTRTLYGGINLTSRGASSSFINQTTAEYGQDLVICVQGQYNSGGFPTDITQANKLILCSSSIDPQSIYLRTSGGTYLDSQGIIEIQTSNSATGIKIGTSSTVPVLIGTPTSTTTIAGNLDVKGNTTTFDSTIVQITDNFIVVNNQPNNLTGLDGGLAIKRYQPAGQGTCTSLTGSVISDIAEFTGYVTSVNPATGVLGVTSSGFSTIADTYAGYWLKVTYSDGVNLENNYCWVRRIKLSESPAAGSATVWNTSEFTIYSTTDQTGILGNPTPIEGMDLPASGSANEIPNPETLTGDATLTFSIYPCHWIVSMWDESHKEYALVCTNSIISNAPQAHQNITPHHYINLHINNLTANALIVNSINNLTADVQFTITLLQDTTSSTTPIVLDPSTSIPSPIQLGYTYPNHGIFMVLVRPKSVIQQETSPYAMFVIGRRKSSTLCGQVARLIAVKGSSGEMLDMDWPPNSYPRLYYRPAPGSGSGSVDYTLKFVTV
jgi:hypothetical protein